MTIEQRQPNDHRVRNRAVVLAGGALAVALAFGAGGALSNKEPARGTDYLGPTPAALATPTTSEASASPSPEAKAQNFHIEVLGAFEVQPGDMISGDVAMSDTKDSAIFPLYDTDTHKAADVVDNTKTALFVEVQAPGVAHAQWGADVVRGLTAEKKAEFLKNQTLEKKRSGFTNVDVVIWNGYSSTVDEAGVKANGEQGSAVNPSENGTGYNLDNLDNQSKLRIILNLFAEGTVDPNSEEGKVLMDVLVNCLCNCETPIETPKPTPTPEVCVVDFKDTLYDPKKGPIKVTTKGLVVRGDVYINGKRYFDDLSQTAAIDRIWTETPKTYTVSGKYAADVLWMEDCATKSDWQDQVDLAISQIEEEGRPLDPKSLK